MRLGGIPVTDDPAPVRIEAALGVPTHVEPGNVVVLGLDHPMAIVDPSSVALIAAMRERVR